MKSISKLKYKALSSDSPFFAAVEARAHLARLGTLGLAVAALSSVQWSKHIEVNNLPFLAAVVASAVTTTGVSTISSAIFVAVVAIGIAIFQHWLDELTNYDIESAGPTYPALLSLCLRGTDSFGHWRVMWPGSQHLEFVSD